jgi:hypothetical protein
VNAHDYVADILGRHVGWKLFLPFRAAYEGFMNVMREVISTTGTLVMTGRLIPSLHGTYRKISKHDIGLYTGQ